MPGGKTKLILHPRVVPAKILIVRLGAIGDVLQALPALYRLRKEYPRAHIAWAVEDQASEIVQAQPELDEVVVFERRKLKKLFRWSTLRWFYQIFWSFIRLLRRRKFPLSIDLHNLFRSGLVARLSGAPARMAPKPSREGNWLFNNWRYRIPRNLVHTTDRHLALLRPLGVDGEAEAEAPRLPVGEEDEEYIATFLEREGLNGKGRLVLLNPGANWQSKLWPHERYGELAERFATELDLTPVVTWGPGEEELAKRVVKISKDSARLAYPTTLRQLAALCQRAALFVGPDTGPMHIAASAGTPVVALYGPSSPQRFAPRGPGETRLLFRDLRCRGCMKRRCRKLDCMRRITVHEVFMSSKELLDSS